MILSFHAIGFVSTVVAGVAGLAVLVPSAAAARRAADALATAAADSLVASQAYGPNWVCHKQLLPYGTGAGKPSWRTTTVCGERTATP
jgi:hypothetical protein